MPRGDEEEIAVRYGGAFRFFALPATRALLERPIEPVILIRDQQSLMANVFDQDVDVGSYPRPCAYVNFVAGARLKSNRPAKFRMRCSAIEGGY